MGVICKECGFENEDGDKYCAMCNADLTDIASMPESPQLNAIDMNPSNETEGRTASQIKTKPQEKASGKYYVFCDNSRSRTYVSGPDITSYYCEGCKDEHKIDGFFWIVKEEMEIEPEPAKAEAALEKANAGGQHLVLEDVDTHTQIEIGVEGGTFGRYGNFGSEYLQRDTRGRMVSGEHCRFRYEYGRWTIEHLSRTNDTVYNGLKLEHGYEQGLRDGKILTLANIISFKVKIF